MRHTAELIRAIVLPGGFSSSHSLTCWHLMAGKDLPSSRTTVWIASNLSLRREYVDTCSLHQPPESASQSTEGSTEWRETDQWHEQVLVVRTANS